MWSYLHLYVNHILPYCNSAFIFKAQRKWDKPGACEIKQHEGIISSHPGEDRDTDSEDEDYDKKQLPVPIQDEPVEDSCNSEANTSVDTTKESEEKDVIESTDNTTEDVPPVS